MPIKQAKYYSYGSSTVCAEIKKFIEEAGVLLDVRDLEKSPLKFYEIQVLIGHVSLKHFLNPNSESYKKHKLDQTTLTREEIFRLMVEDHSLFKQPIIKTTRLLTVGCDKKIISEVLQLNFNGNNNSQPNGNTGLREMNYKPAVRKTSHTPVRK